MYKCLKCNNTLDVRGEYTSLYFCRVCNLFYYDPATTSTDSSKQPKFYQLSYILRDIASIAGVDSLIRFENIPLLQAFIHPGYSKIIDLYFKLCDSGRTEAVLDIIHDNSKWEDKTHEEGVDELCDILIGTLNVPQTSAIVLAQTLAFACSRINSFDEYRPSDNKSDSDEAIETKDIFLEAVPPLIRPGQHSKISWKYGIKTNKSKKERNRNRKLLPDGSMKFIEFDTVTSHTKVSLVDNKGDISVAPLNTSIYTISFITKNQKTFKREIKVVVSEGIKIESFSATPQAVVLGDRISLNWQVKNHVRLTVRLEDIYGRATEYDVTHQPNSTFSFMPHDNTTALLIAKDSFGETHTAVVNVGVKRPPQIATSAIPQIPQINLNLEMPKLPSITESLRQTRNASGGIKRFEWLLKKMLQQSKLIIRLPRW